MPLTLPTATLVGAGIGAAAGAAQLGVGAASNKRAYKWSKKYFEEVTLPQWRRENEWNLQVSDPSFIMNRYRKAGVNPHLAAAQGAPTYQSASASTGTPRDQFDMSGFAAIGEAGQRGIMAYMQAKQMEKNLDLTDEQIRKAAADADVARQLADGNYGTNRAASVAQSLDLVTVRMEDMRSNIALRAQTASKIAAEIRQIDSRIEVNDAQISKILSDIDINAVRQSLMRSQIAINRGTISLQEAQVQSIDAGIRNTDANTLYRELEAEVLGMTGSPAGAGGIAGLLGREIFGIYKSPPVLRGYDPYY